MHDQQLTILVKTADILTKLKANREKHAGIVEEAREGFAKAARKSLEEALKKVSEGNRAGLHVFLPAPVDHTKDYDLAIEMLQMHTSEDLHLTQSQFKTFVLDSWGWQNDFVGTNSSYVPSLSNN